MFYGAHEKKSSSVLSSVTRVTDFTFSLRSRKLKGRKDENRKCLR